MSNIKKLMMTAAGGEALNVEDVFSTYLYTAEFATAQTINNGVDLDSNGGLIWFKKRVGTAEHALFDSTTSFDKYASSNTTDQAVNQANHVNPTTTGFTLSSAGHGPTNNNDDGGHYASWTFRKAPKFFDVVTYTGNGTSGRTISHNLGSVPGCIFIKRTSSAEDWVVYHRGADATSPEDYYFKLNTTAARIDSTAAFNDTAPTSTEFTLGNNGDVNASSQTYVAYLFAHNDGDGDFGPTGDQDIIKCGSFTTDSSGHIIDENIGFEPQWMLLKSSTASVDNWEIVDVMRGWGNGGGAVLNPNASSAEYSTYYGSDTAFPQAQGFTNKGLYSNHTYIYIAIRRGPMAVPESATDVFAIQDGRLSTVPQFESGFAVDMAINRYLPSSSNPHEINARLTGNQTLNTSATSSEVTRTNVSFDFMDGYYEQATPATADHIAWMWRRAPSFFDVITYTGSGTSQTLKHNLGVAPEMLWFKNRGGTSNWDVYVPKSNGTEFYDFNLNENTAPYTRSYSNVYHRMSAAPDENNIYLNTQYFPNATSYDHICYAFASLAGVSKIGIASVTPASSTSIDCGFSSSARFVLYKDLNGGNGYDWKLYDSERGIVSGNDPFLLLNNTDAEVSADYIDPTSNGFAFTGNDGYAAGDVLFYAIA